MEISKEDILQEIREKRDEFSEKELLSALKEPGEENERAHKLPISKEKLVSAVGYSIGSLIVFLGVLLLSFEFWGEMGSFFRIGITLGMGILIFAFIVFLEASHRGPRILKEPLSILSSILVFGGSFVLVQEIDHINITPGVFVVISVMLTAMFGGLYAIRRSRLYLLFIIISITAFFYSTLSLEPIHNTLESGLKKPEAIFAYLTSLIGVSYLLVVYNYLKQGKLSSLLYFTGSIALVSPFFVLNDMHSAPAWNIFAVLLIITLSIFALTNKKIVIAIASTVLLIGSIINYYESDIFSIIFLILGTSFSIALPVFVIWLLAFRKKELGILPYLLVITASLTLLPYTFLSLNFIQEAINLMNNPESIYLILTSLMGLSYILTGYFLDEKQKFERFSNVLYLFGSFGLIVPFFFLAFIYTGIWDVVSIMSIIAIISLGVYQLRKILIIPGGVLLSIHVILVSLRYFADSIGWPVTLIILGFLIMAVGYMSYHLSQKIARLSEINENGQ
ncbi:MAG: DUF2157 domain-containing protein [Patescibacteria group bacterium]